MVLMVYNNPMSNPLDTLADTFVCVLERDPSVAYGPYDAEQAARFLDKFNTFVVAPDRFVSIPTHKVSV